MSTAQEIEQAIRSLSSSESAISCFAPCRASSLSSGEWDRIIEDETPRGSLTALLNETEADYKHDPDKFPPMSATDLNANA
jgi:hypothetical protein